jgi:hypothetical protein
MSTATSPLTRTSHGVAVTVLGLVTLLVGAGYGAFACSAIFAGADWFVHPSKEPMVQVVALGGIVPGLIVLFGMAFLPLGVLGLCAGVGVLWRKQWGRVLTFILAVVAILLGLLWLGGSELEPTDIAIGAGQLLYGVLALVILFTYGAEFSRSRV